MAWKVDPNQSKIEFLVTHLKVTTVRGRFESLEGTLDMNEEDPQASTVQGTVDSASVKTGISLRDNSLRAPGRFDAQRFPKISFRSTRIGPFEGNRFQVFGDLTIKDITRPVVFDIVNKGEVQAGEGERRWAFGATIVVNRKDFDIKWNPLMEVGGMFVNDEIKGELEMLMVQE